MQNGTYYKQINWTQMKGLDSKHEVDHVWIINLREEEGESNSTFKLFCIIKGRYSTNEKNLCKLNIPFKFHHNQLKLRSFLFYIFSLRINLNFKLSYLCEYAQLTYITLSVVPMNLMFYFMNYNMCIWM